jgi:hypothetical protein
VISSLTHTTNTDGHKLLYSCFVGVECTIHRGEKGQCKISFVEGMLVPEGTHPGRFEVQPISGGGISQ